MHRKLALAIPLILAATTSCLQMSMSSGTLGSSYLPWEFQTQYAFWDVHEYEIDGDKYVLKEREREDDGTILYIRLFGFMFNPGEDRRMWTSQEWRTFRQGTQTEPYFLVTVRQADQLDEGDEIEFDSNEMANIDATKPNISVSFSPGNGTLDNGSEYPDEIKPFGSRVIAKLTLDRKEENAGYGRTLAGTLTYERQKADGDPGDVVEGEVSVNFQAMVVGERLAECNESTSEFGSFGGGGNISACDNLNPEP